MRVVNGMFGKKLGGLEQVFADYSEALMQEGCEVMSLVQPGAGVIAALDRISAPHTAIANFSQYDPWAVHKIRQFLKAYRPDAVIAQGNRAIALLMRAAKNIAPLIAVNHSVNVRRSIGADAVIAINDDMRRRLIEAGQKPSSVYTIFNMIKPPASFSFYPKAFAPIPVIGAAGRFVTKKRFDIFLEALAILVKENVAFKAILAGDGPLADALKEKAKALDLLSHVSFPGWLSDKEQFYNSIDIFCFSSEHDVCPVVLLEAYLYGKPVVMTNPPGPAEIADAGKDAIVVSLNDPVAMAQALKTCIENEAMAQKLGLCAHEKAMAQFTMATTAPRLVRLIRDVAGHVQNLHAS